MVEFMAHPSEQRLGQASSAERIAPTPQFGDMPDVQGWRTMAQYRTFKAHVEVGGVAAGAAAFTV
ncbi:hypothetical protein [Polyangium sorediatum]|uniref:Uncharacterized protein n=1 Tax=Polyangium sorediatum TaxID=889274 RepID=A0ABT6NRE2_9BACT|nr:hypothetical protein [Polyangium sorediatum]MDI1430846.1 hypothetical protein [Polyangium sorediatum]